MCSSGKTRGRSNCCAFKCEKRAEVVAPVTKVGSRLGPGAADGSPTGARAAVPSESAGSCGGGGVAMCKGTWGGASSRSSCVATRGGEAAGGCSCGGGDGGGGWFGAVRSRGERWFADAVALAFGRIASTTTTAVIAAASSAALARDCRGAALEGGGVALASAIESRGTAFVALAARVVVAVAEVAAAAATVLRRQK